MVVVVVVVGLSMGGGRGGFIAFFFFWWRIGRVLGWDKCLGWVWDPGFGRDCRGGWS